VVSLDPGTCATRLASICSVTRIALSDTVDAHGTEGDYHILSISKMISDPDDGRTATAPAAATER
jgi:hypothetical protein